MPQTIFFSWQADRPSENGRNLIGKALKKALKLLKTDADVVSVVRDELVVDSDTKGVPGSPPIVDTIFQKISDAAIFVPDLTFVGTRERGLLICTEN